MTMTGKVACTDLDATAEQRSLWMLTVRLYTLNKLDGLRSDILDELDEIKTQWETAIGFRQRSV